MYVRCPKCGITTRTAYDVKRGVTCVYCRWYSPLHKAKNLGSTPQQRFRRAYGFARANRIDLASAYSVLLGIISLNEALPIPESYAYDPGFRDAVDKGFLTDKQASERGDRVVYASTIGLNHGVDMKLAFLVADNRMTLPDAITAMELAALPPPEPTQKLWGTVEVVAAAAMIGVTLLAMFPPGAVQAKRESPTAARAAMSQAQPPVASDAQRAQPPSKPPEADFKTDAQGRVTQVSGRDPKAVLAGLCAHEQFARDLSPVALTPAVPPRAGVRLGLVRDMRDLSAERCVAIRRDRRTGRWSAGDGRHPIQIEEAPDLPPGTESTPM